MSEAGRNLVIAALMTNRALRDATALVPATANVQQAAQFDALVQDPAVRFCKRGGRNSQHR
jgi:hypothetical protein